MFDFGAHTEAGLSYSGGSRWYVDDQSFDRRLSDEMGTAVRIERAPRCRVIDICKDGTEPGAKWLKFLPRSGTCLWRSTPTSANQARSPSETNRNPTNCCANIRICRSC